MGDSMHRRPLRCCFCRNNIVRAGYRRQSCIHHLHFGFHWTAQGCRDHSRKPRQSGGMAQPRIFRDAPRSRYADRRTRLRRRGMGAVALPVCGRGDPSSVSRDAILNGALAGLAGLGRDHGEFPADRACGRDIAPYLACRHRVEISAYRWRRSAYLSARGSSF